MERFSDTAINIINSLHTERLDYNSEYIPLIDAANRLKEYEDVGLEPEEIIDRKIDPVYYAGGCYCRECVDCPMEYILVAEQKQENPFCSHGRRREGGE